MAPAFTLSSDAFNAGEPIPRDYTCEGSDRSPPLSWRGAPVETKSFALIVDDPDAPDPAAPKTIWVHWVAYNIPASATGLQENATRGSMPPGTREGLNDWKASGYRGPCPPIGRHRYYHRLYALDALLPDLRQATKPQLETAMKGHVLGTAELMGTYQKRASVDS
jgi:Raf kinase inhibitor-like YbhB/YbcL family protein